MGWFQNEEKLLSEFAWDLILTFHWVANRYSWIIWLSTQKLPIVLVSHIIGLSCKGINHMCFDPIISSCPPLTGRSTAHRLSQNNRKKRNYFQGIASASLTLINFNFLLSSTVFEIWISIWPNGCGMRFLWQALSWLNGRGGRGDGVNIKW